VARPPALALAEAVKGLEGVAEATVVGSVRRWCETVGDINIVAALEPGFRAGDADEGREIPLEKLRSLAPVEEVAPVPDSEPPTVRVRLGSGLEARVVLVPADGFWSAVRQFTGSAVHNERLAEKARALGFELTPAGALVPGDRDGGTGAGEGRHSDRTSSPLPGSEEEFYHRLGLPLIPPELREGTGEVEAAERGELPRLVEPGDIRGDLHVHSEWSDGGATLEDLARAGQALGYDYVAVSDHSKSLAMAGGLDEKRLLEQKDEIEELNRRLGGESGDVCRLLAGVEVDILSGGELDLADTALAEMDFVTASIHSRLRAPGPEITERLVSAAQSEHVDVIAHPTGRLLGRREPSEVDFDAVLEAAAHTGTFLEINASPERLDLKDEHAARARAAGCLLTISTDAHSLPALGDMSYGVAVARRARLEADDVVNTRPWSEIRKMLGARRPRRA